MTKLSSELVFEIKKELKKGVTLQKDLAKKYNVSSSTITKIKKGYIYSYVVVPSAEYSKGYEDGYKQGVQSNA